jgi:hypothetical protein
MEHPPRLPTGVPEVWVDRVKMMDLRIGTEGGGANVGITFYDARRHVVNPTGCHAIKGNWPQNHGIL